MSPKNHKFVDLESNPYVADRELAPSRRQTGFKIHTAIGPDDNVTHKNPTTKKSKFCCFKLCCRSSKNEIDIDKVVESADPSLIMGAERTLFAALNNAWLLAIGGIGLMSVGNDDERATYGGIVVLSLGILSTVAAFVIHFTRVNHLKHNDGYRFSHTICWTAIIAALTIAALTMELYFGILHPYLDREKAVTIANGDQ